MRNLLIFIIFLLLTFSLSSQSFGKKQNIEYLFLNSYPIRAKVFFDGKDTNTLTPCVIKNINPDVKISVKKNGYKEYVLTKSDMGLRKFDINLIPSSFDLYFPERVFYKLGSTETKGPVYVSKLKSGQYDMSVSGDKIIFRKTSNFLPAYVGLGTAFGISLASTAILIGVAEFCNFNANEAKISGETASSPKRFHYEETTKNIDTYAKIPAISLTGVLFTALISVIITDAVLQYNYKKEKMEVSDKTPSSQDGMFYDTALQYLGSGEITKANDVLQSIISLYPDSEFVPKTYYQLGQNYYIIQDYDNALKNWEIFLRDYPIADYYDYVLRNLADIYYQKKELLTARNQLDKMVFTENVLNRESIFSLRAKLNYELYLQEQSEDFYLITEKEYLKLIDDFKNSERLETYFIQLLKLYNYKADADKISKLKEKAINLDGVNEKIKEIILSYFN